MGNHGHDGMDPYEEQFNRIFLDKGSLETPEGAVRLAGRGKRLIAHVIDMMAILVLTLPFFLFKNGVSGLLENHDGRNWRVHAVWGCMAFLILNVWLLATRGQTIGKARMKIRILSRNGKKASLFDILCRRYLPFALLEFVPGVGHVAQAVDAAFVFGKDRTCLHDRLANTVVVEA